MKPQAPPSLAEAQGGCHHNPGRASQSTALRLPPHPSGEDSILMGGLQREPESLKGTTESSVSRPKPGLAEQRIRPGGGGEIRQPRPGK